MYGQVHFTSLLLKQLIEGRGVFWFRVSEGESTVKAQACRGTAAGSQSTKMGSDLQLHTESREQTGGGLGL